MIRIVLTVLNVLHITCSVFVNDDDSLWANITTASERTPGQNRGQGLAYDKLGRRTSKTYQILEMPIMGCGTMVTVTKGRLDFGPWEQIFYGEFDGRRRKRVLVKIIGE